METGRQRGIVSFFKSRPILLLLLLSPGISEYLSGSSALNNIILNPPAFAFGVIANLGLYGPGVLLIREAKIRWHKGWATVLFLGAAYGILEEGVAPSTLFQPDRRTGGQARVLRTLVGRELDLGDGDTEHPHVVQHLSSDPSARASATGDRRTEFAQIEQIDQSCIRHPLRRRVHTLPVRPFWRALLDGDSGTAFEFGCILRPRLFSTQGACECSNSQELSPEWSTVLDGCRRRHLYPAVLVTQSLGSKLLPAIDAGMVVLVQIFFLGLVLRTIGRTDNERNLIAFSAGLIVP